MLNNFLDEEAEERGVTSHRENRSGQKLSLAADAPNNTAQLLNSASADKNYDRTSAEFKTKSGLKATIAFTETETIHITSAYEDQQNLRAGRPLDFHPVVADHEEDEV